MDDQKFEESVSRVATIRERGAALVAVMMEGVHYGSTGGKPTLMAPGAKLAIDALGYSAEFFVQELWQQPGAGLPTYSVTVKCVLHNEARNIVTSGVGNAHSGEDGLSGLDPNAILKIAAKRAEVDAALRIAGLAEYFTQDMPIKVDDSFLESPPAAPPAAADIESRDTQRFQPPERDDELELTGDPKADVVSLSKVIAKRTGGDWEQVMFDASAFKGESGDMVGIDSRRLKRGASVKWLNNTVTRLKKTLNDLNLAAHADEVTF